jgi:predicted amidophosphoribosyltransferase
MRSKNIPVKTEKNIFYLLYPLLCAGRIFSTKVKLKNKMGQCSQCGSSVPDEQSICSMCMGDINHGSDEHYQRWAEQEQQRERENEEAQAQYEAEQTEYDEQQRRDAEQDAYEAEQQAMHEAEQEAAGQAEADAAQYGGEW